MAVKEDIFIELPLGVLAIFLVAAILGVWIELGFQQQDSTGTSLIELAQGASALEIDKSREQFTVPLFFVTDGHTLVAWDANQLAVRDACANNAIIKPAQCGNASCVCVCAEGSACRGPAVNCRRLEGVESISANMHNDNFIGEQKAGGGSGLLVYGDCGVGHATMTPITVYLYFKDKDRKQLVVDTQQKMTVVNLDKNAAGPNESVALASAAAT